ncbi:molybdenum cofactor biosynthesis protein MoaE [Anaplasmataceae bacterium AB001_6]|nr:molybdenum cofactor biosynthesis protein MoaE [Anaplasmataceae bacterium AB001_6]
MGKVFVDVWDTKEKNINIDLALSYVNAKKNGAESLFIGTVRDFNHGKNVIGISYDVFESLAKRSFLNICKEAQDKWGDNINLYVVHAKGRLSIGGISIIIAVGSPHRDEAFKACRYVIEEIKHRSPIWKLEHYTDGDSQWSKGCELCKSQTQGI